MAMILSLSAARKARVRAEERRQADENAVKFGRTKAQKTFESAQITRANSALDGKEREPG